MVTSAYDMTIAESRWRIIHNGIGNQNSQIVKGVPLGCQGSEQPNTAPTQLCCYGWQPDNSKTQSDKFTGSDGNECMTAKNKFKIDQCVQRQSYSGPTRNMIHQ